MNENTIELFEAKIEELEEQNKKLQDTIDFHERCQNFMIHRFIDEEAMAKQFAGYDKLPLPRMEMQINPLTKDWYEVEWLYGLVYRHYDDSIMFIPFGRSTLSSSLNKDMANGGTLVFPHRDGLHIRVEMKMLNLHGYVICQDRIERIGKGEYSDKTYEEAMLSMKRKPQQ